MLSPSLIDGGEIFVKDESRDCEQEAPERDGGHCEVRDDSKEEWWRERLVRMKKMIAT